MIPPGTAVDKKQALESLRWVREMNQDSRCFVSIASHEIDMTPQTIEILENKSKVRFYANNSLNREIVVQHGDLTTHFSGTSPIV